MSFIIGRNILTARDLAYADPGNLTGNLIIAARYTSNLSCPKGMRFLSTPIPTPTPTPISVR